MVNILTTFESARRLFAFAMLAAMLVWGAATAAAQQSGAPEATPSPQQAQSVPQEAADEEAAGAESSVEPRIRDYRGVTIGMDAAEARRRLGDRDSQSRTDDFFRVSDHEMAQVYYDASGKVRAISIMYVGRESNAPQSRDVLGEDVQPAADGRAHKLIRYPQAGYWVAYSRTAGDSPLVTVTIQRMRAARTAN